MEKESKEDSVDILEKEQSFRIVPIVLDVGFSIAIPLVLFALIGRLLDKHLETSPLLLLISICISIVISSAIVWRKMKQFF